MDASNFWNVIAAYNRSTLFFQIGVLVFIGLCVFLSYRTKAVWLTRFALAVANLFICFGFFFIYGTEPIQKFFAFPLYFLIGTFFFIECFIYRSAKMQVPSNVAMVFFALYILYPIISMIFGGVFPKMVTHIMPCPVVTLSIALYSCYQKRSKILICLLTIWGLTGIKAFFVGAYEDIILLLVGIYGIYLFVQEIKFKRENQDEQ